MEYKAAFIMIIGPGEANIAIDSLDSIKFYYPDSDIWLLDDHTIDGTYEKIKSWVEVNGGVLYRNHEANGYVGLLNSLFSIFLYIKESKSQYDFVIKMDTDACLSNFGIVEHISGLFEREGPGMIGSYKFSPTGKKRKIHKQFRNILIDSSLIGFDKYKRTVRIGETLLTKHLFPALKNGYFPGEHVLGGLYALHYTTVEKLIEAGFINNVIKKWTGLTLEDIIISMGVKSIGHKLIDINTKENLVAWLQYSSPLPLTGKMVLRKKLMALHPLKNDKEANELRQYLKQRRI